MHVAIIGGASTIGSTVAYTLAGLAPTVDVSLVDIDEGAAWAHATDVSHAGYHFANAPGASAGYNPDSVGTIDSATPGELPALDPDLLIFNAAAPQPEDATDRGAREAELERNREIVEDVAEDLTALDPTPLLVVTNPIDRLVYHFYSLLGWPRRCFLGYSLSETARAADALADGLGVHRNDVYCPMMGEHGENVVPVFSRARVDGEPVEISADERADVREFVRDVPFEIAKKRGVGETSRWVTSAGVTRVVRTMLAADEQATRDSDGTGPFCLSTPLAGEYGFEDVALSVPVDVDAGGVAAIHEWELTDEETEQLTDAYDAVRADLA
ncbi:lactate dehydrogenase [Halobellus sp. Atlit-38R]|uniref:malate dehydrogenase n=1 Tax=Halobellus sp. Atlit-38R TaxID=2282131 RepID=UPI000EF1E2BF|nr:lactate dehydrogenase [Halobellus sp. Atlit-38R]RLM88394.1 lactate dehydrogenase [Halobellus sp. Atlit-38R]